MVEVGIGNRGSIVQDNRACSVEVRVGAVALELVGVTGGSGSWRRRVIGSGMSGEAKGLTILWRVQRDLGGVRGVTTSS